MPEMRIRTKMKNVTSDRTRRENVPRDIFGKVRQNDEKNGIRIRNNGRAALGKYGDICAQV